MSAPIEIYCEWKDFGYVAHSPQSPETKTGHHAGMRGAAEEMARSILGVGFSLTFQRRGFYIAKKSEAR